MSGRRQIAVDPRPRFDDPAAGVVWAAICALPEGAQHEIANYLVEHLALVEQRPGAQEVRVARGVAALREAATMLGGASPSVGKYRELRERHPGRRWPDDSSIRGWLSDSRSWNDALQAARLDALPDPRPAAPGHGPNLTADEILGALRECARDLKRPLGEVTWSRYLRWVRSAGVRRLPGRRPRSQGPFDRLGGFRVAKRLAAGAKTTNESTGDARSDGKGYRYSDRELFRAADEIIARLGPDCSWPTTTQWPRERQRILDSERTQGLPPRAFPSISVIWSRFGSWEAARHAYEQAGGEDRD